MEPGILPEHQVLVSDSRNYGVIMRDHIIGKLWR